MGLKTGHRGRPVVGDDHDESGIVVDCVDEPGTAAVKERRIADEGKDRFLESAVGDAAPHRNGSSHAIDRGLQFHGRKRSGIVTADVTGHDSFGLARHEFQRMQQTSVAASDALRPRPHRRADRERAGAGERTVERRGQGWPALARTVLSDSSPSAGKKPERPSTWTLFAGIIEDFFQQAFHHWLGFLEDDERVHAVSEGQHLLTRQRQGAQLENRELAVRRFLPLPCSTRSRFRTRPDRFGPRRSRSS